MRTAKPALSLAQVQSGSHAVVAVGHSTTGTRCGRTSSKYITRPDRLRQHLVEHHGISRAEVFKDVLEGLPTEQGGEDQPLKGGLKAGANFLDMDLRCRVCGKEFTSPKTLHDHRTRGWHDPFTKVECPFGCDGRQYPSLSTLLHHLEDGNQFPPTKSMKKTDFNSWSALSHSIESLLCAGEIEGVQKALDHIETRLRTLCMEEADKMID
ncbi:hypothetical protein K490DRAFT_55654 [Saccharata proteae CBS 121410]|uniref:C2H2-type domain-containing protein n=1 Tax=Saccharata proteae CBS 121410 TaxID=1314787 RepID=A0A6A5YBN1_9PEZI|nr:hypothetical protein K490DRAFT_55654 [Saccharata proteae CBS 121410]